MRITTKQASERLNCSPFVIQRFRKAGILTDFKPVNPRHARHYPLFDSAQVSAVGKVYRTVLAGDSKLSAVKLATLRQSVGATEPLPVASRPRRAAVASPEPLSARLTRIEDMIGQLLAVWS